ncbi:hypothetical protein HDE76_003816 [Rhodanobacter sp. ANJX3]|uniref:hypothetical protein n=1 Tax=unclassified Rhodanobacter TaxID=2621553 RepID=UPI001837B446|nr:MULTISPECIES: hypothetical protein [unclassified Rhodanobacter]MBB5360571.1 hypothetical protein [Rhodanobacter sp. ANJX3]NYE30578.1 hypothetical protein [Rhodanobacter sp. K2T2]
MAFLIVMVLRLSGHRGGTRQGQYAANEQSAKLLFHGRSFDFQSMKQGMKRRLYGSQSY